MTTVNPNPMTKEQIKAIRAALGLSAPKMALLMRVSERTVFAYESGRSLVPGCVGAYLDLIMAEPAALGTAFRLNGISGVRKTRQRDSSKPIWTLASARR